MLYEAGGGRKKHVGSDGGDQDGVKFGWPDTTLGQNFLGGFHRQVAGCDPLINDMAFADAGPFHYPFVVGVHHLFKVGVSQKAGRDVGAESADLDAAKLAQ